MVIHFRNKGRVTDMETLLPVRNRGRRALKNGWDYF